MATPSSAFDVSTVIALFSLVLSAAALFLSQLLGPRVASVVGPDFQIYYPPDGGFGLYIPVALRNASPRMGTVQRCAISIYRKSSPDERFFMEWRFFVGLNPNLSYRMEEKAHALTIEGNSSVAKVIWLTWRWDSTPPLVITEGEYALIFHYWPGSEDKPRNDPHEFYIDRAMQAELDGYRANKQSTVVNLLLDKKIAGNKLMTTYESKTLLGA